MIRFIFALLLIVSVVFSVYDIGRIIKNTDENLKFYNSTVTDIKEAARDLPSKQVLEIEWRELQRNHKLSRGVERNKAASAIIKYYKELNGNFKIISGRIEARNDQLLTDLTDHLQNGGFAREEQLKMDHRFKVLKQELYRSIEAARNRQFIFSTHIGIRNLKNIGKLYSAHNWITPPWAEAAGINEL